jgi:hypothetical protein
VYPKKIDSINAYESALSIPRERFQNHWAVSELATPELNSNVLELFLTYFHAVGVNMTEPVEGWIRRAGERCEELGVGDLGRALKAHAKGEADHHLMMIDDTRVLVAHWNNHHRQQLDAEQLLAQPAPPSVEAYRKLHEDTIAGDTPWAQLALEYEIESLSVTYGPRLIGRCAGVLPPDVASKLSFVKDHVALDVGHTEFNKRQVRQALEERPESLPQLVETGTKALECYADFLGDCLRLAQARAEQLAA